MSFLAWIILGLVAGFIGSKLVNKRGEGLVLDLLLGIVGAIVGGWLFNRFVFVCFIRGQRQRPLFFRFYMVESSGVLRYILCMLLGCVSR